MPDIPAVKRVSYADHAKAAADLLVKPDDAGRVAAAACRLEPLQKIQVAFDQLVNHAEGHRRGEIGPFGLHFKQYVQAELEGAKRHLEVLATASEAAIAMHKDMTKQLSALEDAMSAKKKDDEGPKLTTDGSPHPLEEGGYEPSKDPQLPSNISDIEALKEGKTTHAQADAIAKADAEANEGKEPTKADEATEPAKPAPTPTPTPKVAPVAPPKPKK